MRAWLCGALCLFLAEIAAADPPPVAAFVNYAKYETVKISPRGTYVALTQRDSDHEGLTVLTLPDFKVAGHTYFGSLTDIERIEWANDNRLLIQPTRRFPGFISYKAPTGEIFGIDADCKNFDILFGYQAGKQQSGTHVRQRQSIDAPARLLATLPHEPDSVLIQSFGYGFTGHNSAVYKMNANTGMLAKIADSPVRDGAFVVDAAKRVAFVYGDDSEGVGELFYRSPAAAEWRLIAKEDSPQAFIRPVGPWSTPGEFLVLDNRDASTTGVFSYAPDAGASKLLFRRSVVDAGRALLDATGIPWAFAYDDHFPEYWYPDPQHPLAQVHRWLRDLLPGTDVDISSATDDMAYAIARVSSPRLPLVYVYLDVKNKKLIQRLVAYPDLKSEDLGDVDPIELKARDGTIVRGYITTPNVPAKKKLPLIVMIHGGPYGVYDTWGFDPEAQLFASRGYAVLQVNFRGSGGRGREFEVSGYQKWGHEMQDDVTDAVRWAVGAGVADPKRMCIYGASYGGYAALTAAFQEPDMFRCAVGMAGVYDLSLMYTKGDVRTVKAGVNYLKRVLGTDTDDLKRRSPVYNADKIRAAVLLMHGKEDQRAPIEHAYRMRAALERVGNPPEWLSEWGENHGFFDEAHRVEAYELMLAFFAKHLGSNSTVAAD